MPDATILRLDILDWWHCAAGRGLRSGANALAVREGDLPYIPGRTLKGVLRDAMQQAEFFSANHADGAKGIVPEGATNSLLGRAAFAAVPGGTVLVEQRFGSQPGLLRIGSASLPEVWRKWARTTAGARMLSDLGETLHRTAIDAEGQAVPHSLRALEVIPPMALTAMLVFRGREDPWRDHGGWRSVVRAALPLLRSIGAGRTRGLGRLTADLLETSEVGAHT